jgi:hypothetical protein
MKLFMYPEVDFVIMSEREFGIRGRRPPTFQNKPLPRSEIERCIQ